jgi:hypothetical protein
MSTLYIQAPPPGGGTSDDTTNLQTCINAAPDGSVIMFNPGTSYNVRELQVFSRAALGLDCPGRPDTLAGTGCNLNYIGSGEAATVRLDKAHRCWIKGFSFSNDKASTPATSHLLIDSDPSIPQTGASGNTTSCWVLSCLFSAATAQTCVNICPVTKSNGEGMIIRDSIFNGGAKGVHFGSSSNLKSELVEDCVFNGCGLAYHLEQGIGTVRNCMAEYCGQDLVIGNGSQFNLIEGWNSEGVGTGNTDPAAVACSLCTANGHLEIRNCRFSAVKSPNVFYLSSPGGGTCTVMRGINVDGNPVLTSAFAPGWYTSTKLLIDSCRIGLPAWNGTGGPIQSTGKLPNGQWPGLIQFQPLTMVNTNGF